jgi:transcription elongation factor SPT6
LPLLGLFHGTTYQLLFGLIGLKTLIIFVMRFVWSFLQDVMFKLVEQHPRDSAEGMDMIKVVYGDESIPSLYENSQVSQEQLPGQPGGYGSFIHFSKLFKPGPEGLMIVCKSCKESSVLQLKSSNCLTLMGNCCAGIVRRAVAVGRFFQNPIAMVASLCGSAKEVLSLRLHPMQSILNSEEVYEAIEYVMWMVTNQVGIDINLAASNDWLFAPLQFIAGLGPRKAGTIQRAIQSVGRLRTRKELYAGLRLMGMKVFINSAGFIRVCGSGQAASGTPTWDPLDNTRIHPESYLVAKNMAKAALKEEATRNEKDVDDDYLEKSVEHVIENPNVLSTVDIKEYAQGVQIRGQTQKFHTLALIKSELQHGFCEWRYEYADPNSDEEFYMLSGESEETLALGRIVQAKVRKVQERRVMCVLPSGLLGFIQQEDLSDEQEVVPSDKMAEGSTVTCRIKDVNKEKYIVDLTCK